jgi:YggT family protein
LERALDPVQERIRGRTRAQQHAHARVQALSAIVFIIDRLLSLALFVALLRLFLQWTRADFRNPISQAVVRLTNPLVMPLRRILPPIAKLDTASVVTVAIVAIVDVGIVSKLHTGDLPTLVAWVRDAVIEILRVSLWTYFYAIFLYALLSLIAPGGYSPVQSLLRSLCEPVLRPFRRLIKPIGGLDLSPLWAGIAIQALLILLADAWR